MWWAMLIVVGLGTIASLSFPILVLSCIASRVTRHTIGKTALAILLVEIFMCAAFFVALVPAVQ
jgi:hypothetical protein